MTQHSNQNITSSISLALLKRLNAHIIKKPKKAMVISSDIVFNNSSLISIVDLKYVITTLKQALTVVSFLSLSNKVVFIGSLDSRTYKSIRTLFNLDSFFYPVYPWYPGLLTNLKKIRQNMVNQKNLESIATDNLNEKTGGGMLQGRLSRTPAWTKALHKLPSFVIVHNPIPNSRIVNETFKVEVPALALNLYPAYHNSPALYSICLNFSDPFIFRLVLVIFKNQQYKGKFSRYLEGYREHIATKR